VPTQVDASVIDKGEVAEPDSVNNGASEDSDHEPGALNTLGGALLRAQRIAAKKVMFIQSPARVEQHRSICLRLLGGKAVV